jgi:hypothetical protein
VCAFRRMRQARGALDPGVPAEPLVPSPACSAA